MTIVSLLHQLANFPGYLVEPALRALAFACMTALVIAIMPGKRAALRLYAWTAVLYVALAMPLLDAFLPHVKVAVPAVVVLPSSWQATAPEPSLTPQHADATIPARHSLDSTVNSAMDETRKAHFNKPDPHRASMTASVAPKEANSPFLAATYTQASAPTRLSILGTFFRGATWKIIAVTCYFLGFGILLIRLLMGLLWARRLARSAQDISVKYFLRKDEAEDARNSAALALLASRSSLAGLKRPPRLKESVALSVPATVGVCRPVILLPVGWRIWTDEELQAVLAHEISHVARRDALTQLLSLLHRTIFWFSPLPWWLDRQLMELAEQASDEAALAGGADRLLYAETLLAFFARLQSVPCRVRWQALSMANRESAGRAERRVDRILTWKGGINMKKSFVIGLIALAAPVIFLAASLHPFVAYANNQTRLEPSARVQSPATATTVPSAIAPAALTTENAAEAPQEGSTNAQKQVEPDEKQSNENANTININGGYTSGPRYVIMRANSSDVTMSGNDEDLHHARALRKQIKRDFIWFKHDEKSYVITDPAFMEKVRALFAPEDELGKKQDELGRQQDELGRQQDALGEQMEKTTVKVPDITPELERIRARLKELQAGGATQSELGNVQSQIGELQSRIGRLQSQAGEQQSEIGRRQSELGRKQGELGRQQGELGRQQGEIARQASRELRRMFDDAIAKGIAKPE